MTYRIVLGELGGTYQILENVYRSVANKPVDTSNSVNDHMYLSV